MSGGLVTASVTQWTQPRAPPRVTFCGHLAASVVLQLPGAAAVELACGADTAHAHSGTASAAAARLVIRVGQRLAPQMLSALMSPPSICAPHFIQK